MQCRYLNANDEDVEFLTKNLVEKKPVEIWKDSSDNFYGFGFDFGPGNIEDKERYLKRFHRHTSTGRVENTDWEIEVVPSGKPKNLKGGPKPKEDVRQKQFGD